jgi:low temperature requirement protein LtrA
MAARTSLRGRQDELRTLEIAGGHLVERFRLFFIIALGETVLAVGNSFAEHPFGFERLLALVIGFVGAVALWWCYFERNEEIGVEMAETADDAGRVGLLGTWTLTLIVLALIGIAVADEIAIAHPGDEPTVGFSILAFGGPALFLLAQLLFLRSAVEDILRSRLLELAALVILAIATAPLTAIVRHRRVDRRARRSRRGRHPWCDDERGPRGAARLNRRWARAQGAQRASSQSCTSCGG